MENQRERRGGEETGRGGEGMGRGGEGTSCKIFKILEAKIIENHMEITQKSKEITENQLKNHRKS